MHTRKLHALMSCVLFLVIAAHLRASSPATRRAVARGVLEHGRRRESTSRCRACSVSIRIARASPRYASALRALRRSLGTAPRPGDVVDARLRRARGRTARSDELRDRRRQRHARPRGRTSRCVYTPAAIGAANLAPTRRQQLKLLAARQCQVQRHQFEHAQLVRDQRTCSSRAQRTTTASPGILRNSCIRLHATSTHSPDARQRQLDDGKPAADCAAGTAPSPD